ncbi:MAG: MFS transporter [Spirochaetes bacterium]|nr:MFS transporter [Spirochaetota bacterium]
MSENKGSFLSSLQPLKVPFFRMIWITNSFSMFGMWMHDVAAAWLMTSLAPSPLMVALIQTATTLPMALLALPAGAFADIFDRKKLLLTTFVWRFVVALTLGLLVIFGLVNPGILLVATFVLSLGSAIGAPVWQTVFPEIVPRKVLSEAVMLNAVTFNTARGVGPAIGGFVLTFLGAGANFIINAASLISTGLVISTWKRKKKKSTLPEERMIGAIRSGVRYVRHSPEIKNMLIHTITFAFCASAMWSLIPYVAKETLKVSSSEYGILLAVFGMGGIVGLLLMSKIRHLFSFNLLIAGSAFLFSFVLFAMAYGKSYWLLAAAMLPAGVSWLIVLSSLMAALQSVAPSWVLGRVMSVHALIFFGTQAGGSAIWGTAAGIAGIPVVLLIAAVLLVISIPATYPFKLITGEGVDLRPYAEWRLSPLKQRPGMEEGPVLVTLEYEIDPKKASRFIKAMGPLKATRRKYGAVMWRLFKDVSKPGHYRESFLVESWAEHIRQHERFTVSDIKILNHVNSFAIGGKPYRVEHYIAEPVIAPKLSKLK